MKLSKLYSNKNNFKEISFNEGINIILGKIKNPDNVNVNCHNLGKSTLVKIIDFMLLKKLPSNSFLKDRKFRDYIFFLEIQINDGRYVTIRRAVNSTKVSLKVHSLGKQNFIDETDWDFLDYTIDGKHSAIKELQNLLQFDILNDVKYRNTLTYFLRAQEDYRNPFQLSKYFKNKDSDWKPFLFELLGYDGQLLEQIYTLHEDIQNIESEITQLQKHYDASPEEIDKIKGLKEVIQKQIDELAEAAENFDFYLEEANISKEIIDDIETQIAQLNVQRYQVESKIRDINEAIESNALYDYEEVYSLYEEMGIHFSKELKCSFDDLLAFNEKISRERLDKLNESLQQKQISLNNINEQLSALNIRRIDLLKKLRELESFEKYKDVQQKIVELNIKKSKIEEQLSAIRSIRDLQIEKQKKNSSLDELKSEIEKLIDIATDKAREIKSYFSAYVKDIIGCSGMLNIKTLSTGNIEFQYNTYDDKGNSTYEKDGHTYLKEICACVDLAILSSYSANSFYKFVLHDGCVDGDDFRIATAYLSLTRKLAAEKGLQIILTIIENDVTNKTTGNVFGITEDEIVLELNDNADGSGKLFGFTY
ncbi:MAG: DUF2326 domain-containing protein [Clostridia bacterium]|nr:DUF2326 domain-containing protein [Clostridia bacterium]